MIKIPAEALRMTADRKVGGTSLIVPVCVDWPELQLTDEQHLANSIARVYDMPIPFEDLSFFGVELPRITDGWFDK